MPYTKSGEEGTFCTPTARESFVADCIPGRDNLVSEERPTTAWRSERGESQTGVIHTVQT